MIWFEAARPISERRLEAAWEFPNVDKKKRQASFVLRGVRDVAFRNMSLKEMDVGWQPRLLSHEENPEKRVCCAIVLHVLSFCALVPSLFLTSPVSPKIFSWFGPDAAFLPAAESHKG